MLGAAPTNHAMVIEPTKLPTAQSNIVQLQFTAAPAVMTLAILCWKPARMNNGTPMKTPQIEPIL